MACPVQWPALQSMFDPNNFFRVNQNIKPKKKAETVVSA
jgi:hypothetical protein